MRRSTVVRLTLLPMLASAAVASADPEPELSPPGMTEQILTPPGVTPLADCEDDPDWQLRPECDVAGVTVTGGIIRGGFGHYFWAGGG